MDAAIPLRCFSCVIETISYAVGWGLLAVMLISPIFIPGIWSADQCSGEPSLLPVFGESPRQDVDQCWRRSEFRPKQKSPLQLSRTASETSQGARNRQSGLGCFSKNI